MPNLHSLHEVRGDPLIKNIIQKIKETTIEAIDLAKRMQEVTSEAFIVHVSIPKRLMKSTVTIQAAKRPFPIGKFPLIQHAIGGRWDKTNTACNFTKLTQLRHSSSVQLTMNLYMRECLNPQSWDKVEVQQGTRGRVLTPQLCDGAEFAIMRGLSIGSREDLSKK